jgi:hypothetical protein
MPHELVAEYDNASGQGVVEVVSKSRGEVYLTIGGETAYRVRDDLCDTCAYIFEKVYPAQSLREGTGEDDARRLAEILKNLERLPDQETLAAIGKVLAPGLYSVMLVRLTPRLAIPGDGSDYFAHEAVDTWGVDPYFGVAHSPHTPYYRLGTQALGDVPYGGRRLGVVLGVPLYPPTLLRTDAEVVGSYREALCTNSSRPTVLALGLVDDRGPANWGDTRPDYTRHLIVTLYILDGHHKIAAAAQAALAVQFLIFLPHTVLGRDQRELVERGVAFLQGIAVAP